MVYGETKPHEPSEPVVFLLWYSYLSLSSLRFYRISNSIQHSHLLNFDASRIPAGLPKKVFPRLRDMWKPWNPQSSPDGAAFVLLQEGFRGCRECVFQNKAHRTFDPRITLSPAPHTPTSSHRRLRLGFSVASPRVRDAAAVAARPSTTKTILDVTARRRPVLILAHEMALGLRRQRKEGRLSSAGCKGRI